MRHGTDSGISFRERKDMREAGGVGANGADLPTWSIDKQFVSPGESFHATWTGDPVWKPLAETIKRAWLISYPARDSSRKLTVQYPHPPQSIKMTVPLSHPPGKFYLSVSWPLYAAQAQTPTTAWTTRTETETEITMIANPTFKAAIRTFCVKSPWVFTGGLLLFGALIFGGALKGRR